MTPTITPEAARLAEELLPCPFCGAAAIVKRNKTVLVDCTGCTATVFQCAGDPNWAIENWNRRARFIGACSVTDGEAKK